MKFRTTISIFLALILTLTACHKKNTTTKQSTPVKIVYTYSLQTFEVGRDTIGGKVGLCVYNEAFTFNFDSTEMAELSELGFHFKTAEKKKKNEQAIWLVRDSTFTQTVIKCGIADDERTIITKGAKKGDYVVWKSRQIAIPQKVKRR